jgi:TonB family protein
MSLCSLLITRCLSVVLLVIAVQAQSPEIQQSLQSRYQDKILVLRGFFPGDKLRFDAAGTPIGNPSASSWTTDGFVLITETKVVGRTLVIQGRRMLVISIGHGFQFRAETLKKRKKLSGVEIEAVLGPGNPSEGVDALMAKVFLTDHDSFVALVPAYWQTCVSAGLHDVNDPKYSGCQFSTDMLSIPGVNAHADLRANTGKDQTSSPGYDSIRVFQVIKGISPPRQTFAPEPHFSSVAREASLEGTVTLGLVVDDQGNPRNVEILYPLGAGLDEEAVRAISTWKFKPAEGDGRKPVAVQIAVEVDFHLH